MQEVENRTDLAWLLALAVILLAALWVRWPVPSMAWTHIDEKAFVNHPLGFFSGDLNPHFFNYPTLQLYLAAGLYYAYWLTTDLELMDFVAWRIFVDAGDILLLARGLTSLMAVGTVACCGPSRPAALRSDLGPGGRDAARPGAPACPVLTPGGHRRPECTVVESRRAVGGPRDTAHQLAGPDHFRCVLRPVRRHQVPRPARRRLDPGRHVGRVSRTPSWRAAARRGDGASHLRLRHAVRLARWVDGADGPDGDDT